MDSPSSADGSGSDARARITEPDHDSIPPPIIDYELPPLEETDTDIAHNVNTVKPSPAKPFVIFPPSPPLSGTVFREKQQSHSPLFQVKHSPPLPPHARIDQLEDEFREFKTQSQKYAMELEEKINNLKSDKLELTLSNKDAFEEIKMLKQRLCANSGDLPKPEQTPPWCTYLGPSFHICCSDGSHAKASLFIGTPDRFDTPPTKWGFSFLYVKEHGYLLRFISGVLDEIFSTEGIEEIPYNHEDCNIGAWVRRVVSYNESFLKQKYEKLANVKPVSTPPSPLK